MWWPDAARRAAVRLPSKVLQLNVASLPLDASLAGPIWHDSPQAQRHLAMKALLQHSTFDFFCAALLSVTALGLTLLLKRRNGA